MRRNIIIFLMLLLVQQIYSNVTINYDIVFNQEELLEINIKIDKENWDLMNKDLVDNLSTSNEAIGTPPMGDRPEGAPPMGNRPEGAPPMGNRPEGTPPMGNRPEGTPPMGEFENTNDVTFDPIWVEADITFNGETLEHVGIRYKGNSSLRSAFSSGNEKLSFKLDFDEFEEEYPEITNQRLYGFKQLNLNNNFNDESLLREKVTSDLFRDFGITSAETSFCVVNIDYGEGIKSFGVYTIVEEMDDTVIETQFSDDSGNLYKPEGDAATFAKNTFNTEEMYKKSNTEENNYSDVKALNTILNSTLRTTNPDRWKTQLEQIFNVDEFLKWLGANSVLQNWDTYGKMSHNFYLYNDPETNLLNWIPWDNNEALQSGKQGGSTILLQEVGDNWPLIRYLLDESEYKEIYDKYIQDFTFNIFTVANMTKIYNSHYSLLKDYSSAVDVEGLKKHVVSRNNAVTKYLEK